MVHNPSLRTEMNSITRAQEAKGKIMVIAGTKFCAWSNVKIPSAELLDRLCS
jgi:hypothetical protein